MRLHLPGLSREKTPAGKVRWRVRVQGERRRKITLAVGPDHPAFSECYHAARRGRHVTPEDRPEAEHLSGSLGWLVARHLDDLERQVAAGQASPRTLNKRRQTLAALADRADYSLHMPRKHVFEIRDKLAATPAWADSTVEAIRVLYRWACERGLAKDNPAMGVPKIDRGRGGAVPWTVADLRQFREAHPPGTTAHLCLTILMFTACRIGDARLLGRRNEFERDGIKGLAWQPEKRGSAFVEIPMMPPLLRATRAAPVVGETYLLNSWGRPFRSADTMSNTFRRWCADAGLDRSAHGVRKATGELLALEGCTQYQIMAIHGHTSAKNSEVYTRGAERWRLARDAMATMKGMEW